MTEKTNKLETTQDKIRIPKLEELINYNEETYKQNALTVLLNQPPPDKWIKQHPYATIDVLVEGQVKKAPLPYLPIDKVEFLFARIFGGYTSTIKDVKVIANSVVVVVTVSVKNPLTGKIESHDGVGAVAIQTDKDKGAMDWNFAKANGVQLAAPAAETYAIKDAAEKWGKIFGKDLTRKDTIGYEGILADPEAAWEDKERILQSINSSTYDSDTRQILTDKVMNGISVSEGMIMSQDLRKNQLSAKENGHIGSMKGIHQLIDEAEKHDKS